MSEPRTAAECLRPYAPDIGRACAEYAVDPYLLAGLLLRETGCGWGSGYVVPRGAERHCGWGDGGHGFGLVQADRRWWGDWIDSPKSKTPIGQFRFACALLRDNWRSFLHSASFSGHDADAWRCSVAAYNAGFGRVLHAYVTGGLEAVDSVTTGHDYSRDVFNRAAVVRGEHPELFSTVTTTPPPIAGATTSTGGIT